ncbi:MAG TPA: SUMF1/EgtB/PvdO family nonheme iron enzyme [Candidatus Paceibacterota bacterium]|nr:SUMF1/EgtB/PvdO family nonheme iron enzyme [Candidatus Paceibacterota bacterium]
MKWGKVVLVIFGALIITALGIDAADTLRGNEGTLLSQVIGAREGSCPQGMVSLERVPGISCVDQYEASAGEKCPVLSPSQILGTQQNLEDGSCKSVSIEGADPWRFVSREQAMQLCARDGKRLPTSAEWYGISLGMVDVEDSCNVNTQEHAKTGTYSACATQEFVYDLVGNMWEWVSDDVIDGTYNMRSLPESGYVSQVDAYGMATAIHTDAQALFGDDYFWSRNDGAYGIIRGGYYASGKDAGVYAAHADTPPNSGSAGIGFRCVR